MTTARPHATHSNRRPSNTRLLHPLTLTVTVSWYWISARSAHGLLLAQPYHSECPSSTASAALLKPIFAHGVCSVISCSCTTGISRAFTTKHHLLHHLDSVGGAVSSSSSFLYTHRNSLDDDQVYDDIIVANGFPPSSEEKSSSTTTATSPPIPSRHNLTPLPVNFYFTALMGLSGALLGPFLDSYHSLFNVLTYDAPITYTLWGTTVYPALITCGWVPCLFGVAAIVIGWLYLALDEVFRTNPDTRTPSIPRILLGIALFTFQYWLSGVLFQYGVDRTNILILLSILATFGFQYLDGSRTGLVTSVATAVGGPLVEVILLQMSSLDSSMLYGFGYHYTDAGETGFFPLWIVPVYFLGGPAVGNLARGYREQLLLVVHKQQQQHKKKKK